jgi:hypothetical protein
MSTIQRRAAFVIFCSLPRAGHFSCVTTRRRNGANGVMVGCFVGGRHPCLIPLASRRAGHFLLRAQEKVTKEKGTPQTCPPGLLPCGSVGRDRGSSTAPPVLTTNARASLPAPLRAFRPRPTTSDGTLQRASCAQKIKQKQKAASIAPYPCSFLLLSIQFSPSSILTHSAQAAALLLLLLERAGSAPSGPLCRGEGAQERPEGWATGRGPVCCQRRMRCQQAPGAPSRSRRAGCPETAAPGWPFFWLLFLTPRILRYALRAGSAVRAAPAALWPRKEK